MARGCRWNSAEPWEGSAPPAMGFGERSSLTPDGTSASGLGLVAMTVTVVVVAAVPVLAVAAVRLVAMAAVTVQLGHHVGELGQDQALERQPYAPRRAGHG